jgi:acid phosphatase type 7
MRTLRTKEAGMRVWGLSGATARAAACAGARARPALVALAAAAAIAAASASAARAATVVVAAVGDMACDRSDPGWNGGAGTSSRCAERRVSDAVVADSSISQLLDLGDIQYACDDPDDFAASYTPTWGRLNRIVAPVPGNHEYQTGPDKFGVACPTSNTTAASYFSYFGAAARAASAGHYSFDLGSWHLIALNANCTAKGVGGCGASSAQTRWLASDLSATTKPCILAYWHQPRWTGTAGNNGTYKAWWSLLYQHHADLVLNGHEHDYQRFAMLDPSGLPARDGIVEIVVGTGGESLQSVAQTAKPFPLAHPKSFGYLRLSLGASGYSGAFVSSARSTLDSFSASCH